MDTPDPVRAGLTPIERATLLVGWIDEGLTYSRRKRNGFRTSSSVLKGGALVLTAASTIILGVQNLDFWTGLGFALVALATVVGAVEPFFNWRSRWVLMEEQVHLFNRLREDLLIGVAGAAEVTHETVDGFYTAYRDIWTANSQRWLEFRRSTEQG